MKYAIELLKNTEDKEQALEALKKTFTISTAAFDMMRTITNCLGQIHPKINMHLLHECMVKELSLDDPDEATIIVLLEAMEKEAEENNN